MRTHTSMNIHAFSRCFLFLFLSSLLFLAACAPSEEQKTTQKVFVGGTDGIVASFEPFGIEEGGFFTVFDTEDFPVEVTIKNKGEEELQPGDVAIKLVGVTPADFEGIPSFTLQNKEVLDKATLLSPAQAGEETLDFTPGSTDATYKQKVIGFTDLNFFAQVDYRYKTRLIIPEVCFKEDLTDPRICEVKGAKEFHVSGAPITVTAVDEESGAKGVVVLKITVKNVDPANKVTKVGTPFDPRFGKLSFTIDEPEKWECKSSGKENEARLVEGTAPILCKLKQPLAEGDLFTKQVGLTFEYVYQTLIQQTVKVKESVE